jgi:hypothetical protein
MVKKPKKPFKPEEVAAQYKSTWQPLQQVPTDTADQTGAHPPDDVSPELAELRRKFLGDEKATVEMSTDAAEAEPTTLVPMVPKDRTDEPSPGAKHLVVQGTKVIGEQG